MNSIFEHEKKIFSPVMIGAPALMNAATQEIVLEEVLSIMGLMDPKPGYYIDWYETGMKRFGPFWGYVDLLTILFVASLWIEPKNYLEIGVASGKSACIVGNVVPDCAITCMDLFPQGNMHVAKNNLKLAGHQGPLNIIRGNSHDELLKLKGNTYDLILVDGDHTKEGAAADLEAVIPMLPRGGVLVFDDLSVPWLNEVWTKVVKEKKRFSTAEYRESAAGVAVGVLRR